MFAAPVRELKASYAFVERNFNLSKRYWGWEIAWLVYASAGALSVSLIGAEIGDRRLILSLVIGAVFWNYLSIVFAFVAETIAWERWEGTLEYTMMAPVRRFSHLFGSTIYAVVYGLIHTAVILVLLVLFFELDLSRANLVTAAGFMAVGSFSIVGIGFAAAILPLLYVERGAQMTFVLQSVLLVVSGVYYSIEILPGWMQFFSHLSPATYILDGVRKGLLDGAPLTSLVGDLWPLAIMGIVFIPLGLWAFGRAERYAKRLALPVAIVHKARTSGGAVEVRALTGDVRQRRPIIVDDMISTGATIAAAVETLRRAGARSETVVAATHGLFVGQAPTVLGQLELQAVLATDTVLAPDLPDIPIQRISVAGLLADAIGRLHRGESLGDLISHT